MKEAVLNFTDPIRYKDKKTNNTKRLSDNIFRDFKLIPRANYTSKKLSLKARNLLTNLFQMIQKSQHKFIEKRSSYLGSINCTPFRPR